MKIHKEGDCEYWYDRSYRCWFAARVNRAGDLAESISAYTRAEILFAIRAGLCPEFAA